ncbi:hypothetical protein [Specibacter cremeus]|uniref:hypothetical protein n=1 Tax=Specibacter cremeus TaxID=1629051 RepID=UPI000F79F963|nr:hypothetical protein [Specibacter cremeus]
MLHLEFHRDTLTDTAGSTLALLQDIAAARDTGAMPVRTYWQPRPGIAPAAALAELRRLAGRFDAVHVFSWDAEAARLPLAAHRDDWLERLRAMAASGAPAIDLLLEFVAGDNAGQLLRDARELRSWRDTLREGEGAGRG